MSIVTRRRLLKSLAGIGVGSAAFQRAMAVQVDDAGKVTREMIAQAEWIAGIELDDEQRSEVAAAMESNLAAARRLREFAVDVDEVPAVVFRPDFFYRQAKSSDEYPGAPSVRRPGINVAWSVQDSPKTMPDEDLAFAGLEQQASLLATKQLSSRELTQLYLNRLTKFDPLLHCVVTMLEEHALQQAAAADERRVQGRSLGVLDGIPWVAKDLVALPPWKTTWGAEPFKEQVRTSTATVAEKMRDAGAVLMAKVTLGAMAWGDQWFGGLTRNPWNPEQGSSGSSAGSASAVAAGLATFALGSETLGSIVSPTTRCRTSGLRPTFGRVSRAGCMPLAWSMDKIGPIARYVNDLAFIFSHLIGSDGRDPTLVERRFQWPLSKKLDDLKIGVTGGRLSRGETTALEYLKSVGATIIDVELNCSVPEGPLSFILGVEAATVFDDAFRHDPHADYGLWPSTFRESQFITAIQYLRANRLRTRLIVETEEKLSQVDVLLGGNDLLLTNLTGHPSLVIACGSDELADGTKVPGIVKLSAAAYREELLLKVGQALQQANPPTPSRPPLDALLQKQVDQL